jgi:hypothetical protein
MATIPQISYGIPAMDYGALTKSLSDLGQQVGQALAAKEYQKQAQAALPAFQEAMKSFESGDSSAGYSAIVSLAAQNQSNPYVQNLANLAMMGGKAIDDNRYKTMRVAASALRAGGGLPSMSSQEDVLLGGEDGGGYQVPDEATPISGGAGTEMDAIMVDGEQLPTKQPQATEEEAIVNLTDILKKKAAEISNPSYRKAIEDSAENPPTVTEFKDLRRLAEQYLAQDENQKKNYLQKNTVDIASNQDVIANSPRLAKFYEFPNAERILGQGIRGMYLKPPVEAESIDKKTGKPIMKAKRDVVENLNKVTGAAINVLNEGKVGDFIANTGGVFNADLTTVDEPVLKYGVQTGESRSVTYIFDKRNQNRRIKIPEGSQGNDIIAAFRQVALSPVSIQDINNRNGIAQLVRVPVKTPEGPTAERLAKQPQSAKQKESDVLSKFPARNK